MSRRLAAALLLVILGAAAAALALARRAQPAYPVSDIAITELYTHEAAHGRLLVGPYSRFGWHHPGPLLFYLLAPAYVLGGGNTAALHAGAFAIALAAIAIVWAVAAAVGSAALGAALAAGAALLLVRLPGLSASPWNPHAVVLPALALIVVCAAAAAGRTQLLPLAALVASFLVQADVALVPFATVLALVSLRRASRRALTVTALVTAAAWAIPLVEQASHSPGNFVELWRFFAAGGRPHVGAAIAVATWSDALTAPFRAGFALAHGAVLQPTLVASHLALALVVTGGAAIAAAIARRHGEAVVAWCAALAAVSSLVVLWSLTRIESDVSDHFAFWIAAIGVADVASMLACVRWPPRAAYAVAAAAAALVVAVGIREVARAAAGTFAITTNAPSAPNFAASIGEYLSSHRVRRPLFRIDQDQWWLAAAILLELDRRNVAYAVEDDWRSMFPDRFAPNGTEDAELTLAGAGHGRDLAARRGNVTVDVSSFIHVEAIPRLGF